MIHFTPIALAKAKEMKAQRAPDAEALRLAVIGGGCSGFGYEMTFGRSAGFVDTVFEFDGLTVLVDQFSFPFIDGTEVDWVETNMAAGFQFNNPNAKRQCGCGNSFGVD